ncbi:MAG: 50S ribosomal protein L9 [Rikenellaceae bacterium]
MEIILKKDVDNLGHKNDIVNVRPGYANNFLIPQGMATLATASAKKVLAENIKQQAHKEAKLREDATALAEKLAALSLSIAVKTSEEGKVYGSVTSAQIAEEIEKAGIAIDKKNISMEAAKELGSFTATVKIFKDIKAAVAYTVVAAE